MSRLVALAITPFIVTLPNSSLGNNVSRDMNSPNNNELNGLIRAYHRQQHALYVSSLSARINNQTHDILDTPEMSQHTTTTGPSFKVFQTKISSAEGSHTVEVYIGGQKRELILDTGSARTACICDGCIRCGTHHKNPPYRVNHSGTHGKFVDCGFHSFKISFDASCDECVDNKCKYGQNYVEGDMWEAYKVKDLVSFDTEGAFGSEVEFGCIYKQSRTFNRQVADGIMGLSIHKDSILEQFYRAKFIRHRIFSQCLAPNGGSLTIGGKGDISSDDDIAYTPLRHTRYQYWVVNLLSVEVGGIKVQTKANVYNKDRGCVFDSGTTFLYFPAQVKKAFVASWKQATAGKFAPPLYRNVIKTQTIGFGLHALPEICFIFQGEGKLCMKASQYFVATSADEYAGTIFFTSRLKSTIIGASVLTNHNIIYDLDGRRIGFSRVECSQPNSTAVNVVRLAEPTSDYPQHFWRWKSSDENLDGAQTLGGWFLPLIGPLIVVVSISIYATVFGTNHYCLLDSHRRCVSKNQEEEMKDEDEQDDFVYYLKEDSRD